MLIRETYPDIRADTDLLSHLTAAEKLLMVIREDEEEEAEEDEGAS